MRGKTTELDGKLLRTVGAVLRRKAEADEQHRRLHGEYQAASDRLEKAKREREEIAKEYRLDDDGAPSLELLKQARARVRQLEEERDGFDSASAELSIRNTETEKTLSVVQAALCMAVQRATVAKAAEMLADLRAWNAKLLEPIAAIGAKAGNGQDLADFVAANVPNLVGIGNALGDAQSAKLPPLVVQLAGGGRARLELPVARQRVEEVLAGLEGRAV